MSGLLALRIATVAPILMLAAACGGGDRGAGDTAGAAASAPAARGDSGMAGMAGMNRPPAKDADHEFSA
jgi:hypothetical protein